MVRVATTAGIGFDDAIWLTLYGSLEQRPFALLIFAVMPFMAFGSVMEMKMYMGEDESADEKEEDRNSSGGIVVESLVYIKTVASLSMEETRSAEYAEALKRENPKQFQTSLLRGLSFGVGQLISLWGK